MKNKYPLPIIDHLFDQLRGAIVFLMIYLRSGYHQVKVIKQDLPKIVFRVRYRNFEFMVILFRLINVCAVFMNLMNRVFYDCLNKSIMVFINDILVYTRSHKEYEKHLRFALQRLRQKQLYAKFSKCEFWLDRVLFFGVCCINKGHIS